MSAALLMLGVFVCTIISVALLFFGLIGLAGATRFGRWLAPLTCAVGCAAVCAAPFAVMWWLGP